MKTLPAFALHKRRPMMNARLVLPPALLLMLVAMAVLPATASAATVIQCMGPETIEFSPGLTLTPKSTTLDITIGCPFLLSKSRFPSVI